MDFINILYPVVNIKYFGNFISMISGSANSETVTQPKSK